MTTRLRLTVAAAVLSAAALLATGCASGAPSTPGATDTPATNEPDTTIDASAAWLDEGRLVGLVTWGSSGCVPVAESVTAQGQTVAVEIADPDPARACTADFAPRTTLVGVPEGVDPTKDVELIVTYVGVSAQVVLAGQAELTAQPGSATEYQPSAGWYDESGIVLLTWGSSTCVPMVEDVVQEGAGATVALSVKDGPCTMDMAPRATLLGLDEKASHDGFTLTLTGTPDLDGVTVPVVAN